MSSILRPVPSADASSEDNSEQTTQAPSDYENELQRLNTRFDSGITHSLDWRKSQLQALLRLIKENEDAISNALFEDLGKCKQEAYTSEIGLLKSDIQFTLKRLKKWMAPKKQSTPLMAMPAKSFIQPEPLGTVLIIGAWNYPFNLTISPLIAAMSAGNCAILKPSEMSPHTSALIAQLIPKYLDNKGFAVVEGGKNETTALLKLAFDKIFYTGGGNVGKIVMRAASEHLTPVALELGGKSPCVVDKTADLSVTANRIVWGKWLNSGQTCVAPDYVLVEQEVQKPFIEALKKALVEQFSKDPRSSKAYGRIVSQRHCQRLASYLEGQTVIHGGQIDLQSRFVSPTLVLDPSPDSTLMQEEIFGPILPIIGMASKQEMLSFIRSRPKPLAAYLFSNDANFESDFVNKVSAGNMCINDSMMFMLSHQLPFGGVGNSGMGRYHGKFGFDCFSHEKSVMRRSFKFENSFRYAPYTSFKSFIIKRFIG